MNRVISENTIKQNVARILDDLPAGVQLVAAAKTRSHEEITAAIDAGVTIIGQNYLQEAEQAYRFVGRRVQWHFIGHLQKNKLKKAVRLFDMIETLDSLEMAHEINKRCAEIDKVMPVLIEINIAREKTKSGVPPENVEALVREISTLPGIRLKGLMTMGPLSADPEDSRPYFIETRGISQKIERLALPGIEMSCLSMGMSASYRVAIEEGANIVRLGSSLFGQRITENSQPAD